MVGCWLGYIHCLVVKNLICTGKLQPFYFPSPLASYITPHVRQWKVIGIYNSFLLCTFWYCYIFIFTFNTLHFVCCIFVIIRQLLSALQLAAASEIKGTQIQVKKEVSTCTHIHHLNMYMCDQEHM